MEKVDLLVQFEDVLNKAFGKNEASKQAYRLTRGFNGKRPMNNAQAAKLIVEGLRANGNKAPTRETVRLKSRDIDAHGNPVNLHEYVLTNRVVSPDVESALVLLKSISPATPDMAASALIQAGFTKHEVHPQALIEVAKAYEIPNSLEVVKLHGVEFLTDTATKIHIPANKKGDLKEVEVCDGIQQLATKRAITNGACDLDYLLAYIPTLKPGRKPKKYDIGEDWYKESIRGLVQALPACTWLDSGRNWFFFNRPCRNRIVTKIQQLFAVVHNPLEMGEFIAAIDRSYREYSNLTRELPDEILVAIAEEVAGCRTFVKRGKEYIQSTSQEQLSEVLTEDMKHIAAYLSENKAASLVEIRSSLCSQLNASSNPVIFQRMSSAPFVKGSASKFSLLGDSTYDYVPAKAKTKRRSHKAAQ